MSVVTSVSLSFLALTASPSVIPETCHRFADVPPCVLPRHTSPPVPACCVFAAVCSCAPPHHPLSLVVLAVHLSRPYSTAPLPVEPFLFPAARFSGRLLAFLFFRLLLFDLQVRCLKVRATCLQVRRHTDPFKFLSWSFIDRWSRPPFACTLSLERDISDICLYLSNDVHVLWPVPSLNSRRTPESLDFCRLPACL